MSISDQLGNLEECARSSLTKLNELGLPVTARSFAVWYAYFTDRLPGLNRELDQLADGETPISGEAIDCLYAKHMARDGTDSTTPAILSDLEVVIARLSAFMADLQTGPGAAVEVRHDKDKKTEGASDPISRDTEAALRAAAGPKPPATRPEKKHPPQPFSGLGELANWKTFHDALRLRAIEVAEAGGPVSLLMIDLDRFADFNERHGSDYGDRALELVARLLSETADSGGFAARYSATEFALVIVGANLKSAAETAEEIRLQYLHDDLFADLEANGGGPLTLSVGVSEYDTDEPLAHFIQRARHALSCAKAEGRDRVVAKSGGRHDPERLELRAS